MTEQPTLFSERAMGERIYRGYAAPPGSGPAGKTCADCEHLRSFYHQGGAYYKCEQSAKEWTHDKRTDVAPSSPACSRWSARQEES